MVSTEQLLADNRAKTHLHSTEVMEFLAKDGWQGPDLGKWTKDVGGVLMEARTVVFQDGNHGLSVKLLNAA